MHNRAHKMQRGVLVPRIQVPKHMRLQRRSSHHHTTYTQMHGCTKQGMTRPKAGTTTPAHCSHTSASTAVADCQTMHATGAGSTSTKGMASVQQHPTPWGPSSRQGLPVCRHTSTSRRTMPDHTTHSPPLLHLEKKDNFNPTQPPKPLGRQQHDQHGLAPQRMLGNVKSNGNHCISNQALRRIDRTQHRNLRSSFAWLPRQSQLHTRPRLPSAYHMPLQYPSPFAPPVRPQCHEATPTQYMGWAQANKSTAGRMQQW
jgi:hypothetical protein